MYMFDIFDPKKVTCVSDKSFHLLLKTLHRSYFGTHFYRSVLWCGSPDVKMRAQGCMYMHIQ